MIKPTFLLPTVIYNLGQHDIVVAEGEPYYDPNIAILKSSEVVLYTTSVNNGDYTETYATTVARVVVGDYVASTLSTGGGSLVIGKIIELKNLNTNYNRVTAVVEYDYPLNHFSDTNGSPQSGFGGQQDGFIFKVDKDGMPLFENNIFLGAYNGSISGTPGGEEAGSASFPTYDQNIANTNYIAVMARFQRKYGYASKIYLSKTNHGFSINDIIAIDGSSFTKATANSEYVIGIVEEIYDDNTFILKHFNEKVVDATNFTGSVGTLYYLTETGTYSTSAPSSDAFPLFIQISENTCLYCQATSSGSSTTQNITIESNDSDLISGDDVTLGDTINAGDLVYLDDNGVVKKWNPTISKPSFGAMTTKTYTGGGTGVQGVQGPMGLQGPVGPQGEQGVQGSQGTTALIVETISGEIATIANSTYVIEMYAKYAYEINDITIGCDSGTCTASLNINSTAITGLSAISVTSSASTTDATALNSVSIGDKISLIITSNSSCVNFSFSIKTTRV